MFFGRSMRSASHFVTLFGVKIQRVLFLVFIYKGGTVV